MLFRFMLKTIYRTPTSFLCLCALLFCTSFALPTKISPPPNSQNLSVNLPPWAQGRLFAISDTAPFAHHLQHDPDYVHALRLVTEFFSTVEEQVNHKRRNYTSNTGGVCNVMPFSWYIASRNVALNRGWPVSEVNGSICVTDYHGVPSSFPLSKEQMRETFGQGFSAVGRYAYRIMLDTVGNWTRIGVGGVPPLEFPSQVCYLRNFGGFRFRGKWRISVGVTNIDANMHVPDGQRVSIGEVHRVENGTIVPTLMTLPINPGTGEEHSVTDRATTIIATWGGTVNPFSSRFVPSTALHNVGLNAALAKGANFAQQMEDVILASNIAILTFPLVLNLVPVSLITNCERWKLVISVLLSDVLTAMPMLIKGAELWSIGNARFTETVTRMGDTFEEDTIAAEVWIATCRVRHNARAIGIVFITVSSLAMVAGVALEMIASSLMSRARKRREQEREEIEYLEQHERTHWKYYNQVCHSRSFMTHDASLPFQEVPHGANGHSFRLRSTGGYN